MSVKKNLKVLSLVLVLLLAFSLSACQPNNADSSSTKKSSTNENTSEQNPKENVSAEVSNEDENLEFKTELYYPNIPSINKDYIVPFIDYDKVFLKKGEEQTYEGRYSNTTADGKFNWIVDEESGVAGVLIREEKIINQEALDNITVNGKKIKLPCKFSDLGDEYAAFDSVDFSRYSEEPLAVYIKDKKTGNLIFTHSDEFSDSLIYRMLDKNGCFQARVGINTVKNNIKVIITGENEVMGKLDLRIAGLGVGNTLNEFYDKFGIPNKVYSKEQCAGYPVVEYIFYDSLDNKYIVVSLSSDLVRYNYKTLNDDHIKNNIVTGMDILVFKEEEHAK